MPECIGSVFDRQLARSSTFSACDKSYGYLSVTQPLFRSKAPSFFQWLWFDRSVDLHSDAMLAGQRISQLPVH